MGAFSVMKVLRMMSLMNALEIRGSMGIALLAAIALLPSPAAPQTTGMMAPSPMVSGNQADPHIAIFGNRYYLFTTGFNCFSSPDLATWTRHANPLDLRTLQWDKDTAWLRSIKPRTWAATAPWAPAAIGRNGKYYFYFSADHYLGVAVADRPEGPYKDAIGKPLFNQWDGIDPMAFIDDDGQAYLFFGYAGVFGGVMVGLLNPDMISWKTPPKVIANNTNGLMNYLEGPFMFKRNGVYYLTYSNDTWQTPNYNVQYATATHPLGPYTWKGRILEKDDRHVGPGHHSILKIPGRDQWYIVYHRYNAPQITAGMPRTSHIDTLRFNEDGSIRKVVMTDSGVRAVDLYRLPISIPARQAGRKVSGTGASLKVRPSRRGRGLTVHDGLGSEEVGMTGAILP
jgi:beta-xylosidase